MGKILEVTKTHKRRVRLAVISKSYESPSFFYHKFWLIDGKRPERRMRDKDFDNLQKAKRRRRGRENYEASFFVKKLMELHKYETK